MPGNPCPLPFCQRGFSRVPSKIQLFLYSFFVILRIDDRLIHGQVIVGWGSRFPIHTYVVVDDEIAEQEWERNLLKMAVPPDKKVEILTIREGVHFITEHLQARLMEKGFTFYCQDIPNNPRIDLKKVLERQSK